MKKAILLFQFSLLPLMSFGQNNNGQISQINPGIYRIVYPQQIVRIAFHYTPANGLQHIISETDLDENEKLEIVSLLKQQIDQLPEAFINKYLNVDIVPLHIDSQSEFGYNLDHQIIIEAENIKQGMSYRNSLKSSLAHQLAYLLLDDQKTNEAINNFLNYLNSLHQTFHRFQGNSGYSIYDQGYISRYANGEITGSYSASTEFAELFAHLTCEENRVDVMAYLEDHPENILSIKASRSIDFLTENVTGFNREYFFPSVVPAYTTPAAYDDVDGEVLLSIHELRSYESIDFEAMNIGEKEWASTEEKDTYEDLPTKSWQDQESHGANHDYRNSENYDAVYPKEDEHQQSSKKNKKKNGKGLLVAGAAIYVLLQLAK